MDIKPTSTGSSVPIDATRLAEARAQRDARRAAPPAGSAEPKDTVDLSSRARDIARFATAAAAAEERAELVNELKAGIDGGDYAVDHEAVAGAMIDEGEA